MKILTTILLLMAMAVGMQPLRSEQCSHHSRAHHCSPCTGGNLCPKKLKLPRVHLSTKPVGSKGTIVYNLEDDLLYYSDGTSWIPLADQVTAPANIFVDPAFTNPNGVTTFKTIQSALDHLSLLQFPKTGVTVTIAPATYQENLVVTEQDSSVESQLRLVGDTRVVVGCGISHGMPWNNGGAATYPALGGCAAVPTGQFATLSSSGNTITVTPNGGAIAPDFTQAQLVAGDKVLIRNTNGVETVHTLVSFTATSLTMQNPIGAVNGVGAFLTICPNVVVRPTGGTSMLAQAAFRSTGMWFDAVAAGQTAVFIGNNNCIWQPLHCLLSATSIALNVFANIQDTVGGVVETIDSAGSTFVGSGAVFSQFNGPTWSLLNCLFAGRSVAGSFALATAGRTQIHVNGSRFLGTVQISNNSFLIVNNQIDISSTSTQSGTALALTNYSSMTWRGTINILEPAAALGLASPIGIRLFNSDMVQPSANNLAVNFSSTNPATTAVVLADAQSTIARLIFGTISIPNSSSTYLLQVLNSSQVEVDAGPTSFTAGVATNGCLVDAVSKLLWNSPSGFSGPSGSTGIGFDVRNQSALSMPTVSPNRTFSNFATIFSFNRNATGEINNVTCTTSSGGTNLSATNASFVEIGAGVTFNVSGSNVGINSSPGGRVEKLAGATFTNSAALPFSAGSCSVLSTTPISSYPCTQASGTIIVTP